MATRKFKGQKATLQFCSEDLIFWRTCRRRLTPTESREGSVNLAVIVRGVADPPAVVAIATSEPVTEGIIGEEVSVRGEVEEVTEAVVTEEATEVVTEEIEIMVGRL